MKGFFKDKDFQSSKISTSKSVLSCFTCGLFQHASHPKFDPIGAFKKKILIIGGTPSSKEDARGLLWQGRERRILEKGLALSGINLDTDCLSINAINCYPDQVSVTKHQLDCCKLIKLIPIIKEYEPKIIILLGELALTGFLSQRWKKSAIGGVTKWRGWTIPDQDYKAWVLPLFHPSYILERNFKEIFQIWYNDLKKLDQLLTTPFLVNKQPVIERIDDLSVLDNLISGKMAFDYETTGIKPHAKGHRIICVSIADTPDHAYVFEFPKKKKLRDPFIRFLQNEKIQKIASNLKYEDQWSNFRVHTSVKGWYWDTMLTAHILDNRQGISGLKFQAYVKLGVVDYDSDISPYLKSKQEGGNTINRIQELNNIPNGIEDLMYYCGLDSIYEYRVALLQEKEIMNYDLPF